MKENDTSDAYAWLYALSAVLLAVLVINQVQLVGMQTSMDHMTGMSTTTMTRQVQTLSGVDVTDVRTTAQGLASVYELEGRSGDEIVRMMIPTGTPEYGTAMGVSFDDPTGSLTTLARAYPALKATIKEDDPETYQRWLDMASADLGMTCEFCCGIQYTAVTSDGRDMCGCQHHPALQSVALWLMQNTDYNDAEVLREVYRWKTLFFPKDMVALGSRIAGGDEAVLELPSMVGGC